MRKEITKLNLRLSIVVKLSESLKNMYSSFFPIFWFQTYLETVIWKRHWFFKIKLYCKLKFRQSDYKTMKRTDIHFSYFDKVLWIKWKDNKRVLLLVPKIKVSDGTSTFQVEWKVRALKSPSCNLIW